LTWAKKERKSNLVRNVPISSETFMHVVEIKSKSEPFYKALDRIAIFIALLFLAVPAAALATNSTNLTITDGNGSKLEDECMSFDPDKAMECAKKFLASLASCYTMECLKEQLIQSCEVEETPKYIDCVTIFECIDLEVQQTEHCAGDVMPSLYLMKAKETVLANMI
jgi:hypothetical protein